MRKISKFYLYCDRFRKLLTEDWDLVVAGYGSYVNVKLLLEIEVDDATDRFMRLQRSWFL